VAWPPEGPRAVEKISAPAAVPSYATPPAPTTSRTAQTTVPQSSPAAAPAGPAISSTVVHQLITVLHESSYPEQREWAAQRLAGVSPQQHPQVVQAVLRAARNDASPMVQIACIRSLVQMNRYSPDVAPALQALKTSGDPRVRLEAGQALVRVGYVPPSPVPASALPTAGNASATR
jgi:hypothetical protein